MSSDHLHTKSIKLENGSQTTIALEPEFWMLLTQISKHRHLPFRVLINEIDATRGELPRAGALRLYAARYFHEAMIGAEVADGRRLKSDRQLPAVPADSGNGIFNRPSGYPWRLVAANANQNSDRSSGNREAVRCGQRF